MSIRTNNLRKALVLSGAVIHSLGCAFAARAEDGARIASQNPDSSFQQLVAPDPTLRFGGFYGALSEQSLAGITFEHPWLTRLQSNYLGEVHFVYTAYRFESLPLDLEAEGGVAKRAGQDHQSEFDFIPMARWKLWPWNDFVYTNFRLGLIGASYVTGISDWEKQNTGNHIGSRYLNLLIPEWTFAPSRDFPVELFVRVHHRSGVYGLINGVHGASNYVGGGFRFVAY